MRKLIFLGALLSLLTAASAMALGADHAFLIHNAGTTTYSREMLQTALSAIFSTIL